MRVALLAALTATVSASLAFHRLGANSLFGDEALYASIAHTVAAEDQWYPIYAGNARYVSKPPLSIWPMALSFEMGGMSEVNARIGSAVGGVIVSMLLFALGTWLVDASAGALAALLLISAPPWLLNHGVREGVGDVWTTFFISVALLAWVRGRIGESRGLLIAAIGAAAAGSLVKGPIVFLVLFTVGLGWEVAARVLHGRRPRVLALCGVVLASAIPFTLWVVDNTRDAALRAYISAQFVGRHMQAVDVTHLHGITFYPHVVREAFGWWLLALSLPLLWRWLRAAELALLLPLWALLPIVTFSVSVSKLAWYLDPALPPLAMLIAIAVCLGIAQVRSRNLRYALVALVVGALAIRIGAAWQAINATPRQTDMHRIALAYRSAKHPALYADTPNAGSYAYREWNYVYLNRLPREAATIPAAIDRSRCSLVVTMHPEPLLQRPDFASAATRQLQKYDEREADLYLIDLCGGHFTRALPSSLATTQRLSNF
ncbi:MAG TPA: glycosyltransferase family 39 protein [Thermoanaerobaculia bacterium]|nr:glycosyltransferase family 39 protein [Thermoanaerobaculia bacterium]